MKLRQLLFLIVILSIVIGIGILILIIQNRQPRRSEIKTLPQEKIGYMKLDSLAFKNNQQIPSKYTCDGENINPPLTLSDIPPMAKSLVLIMDDPDAPAGTWVHWTVWNINPNTKEIAENSLPGGAIEGKTSSGKAGYGGPCPPSGSHRYFFRIYALDNTLSLTESATISDLEKSMAGHILDKAELMSTYSRR